MTPPAPMIPQAAAAGTTDGHGTTTSADKISAVLKCTMVGVPKAALRVGAARRGPLRNQRHHHELQSDERTGG